MPVGLKTKKLESFGHIDKDKLNDSGLLSYRSLQLYPIDFIAHWPRCGVTADFLAKFESFNFESPGRVQNILSTIFNELIENSVKFSATPKHPFSLSLHHYGDYILINVVNKTSVQQKHSFSGFLEKLVNTPTEDLFLSSVMESASSSNNRSKLGLITLKKDYQLEIAVHFLFDAEKNLYNVDVNILIDTEIIGNT